MQKADNHNSLLIGRSLLVILAGISILVGASILAFMPFEELSYVAGITLFVAASLIFGWSCYLGVVQRKQY